MLFKDEQFFSGKKTGSVPVTQSKRPGMNTYADCL
jgi:hypothetical protein